MQLIEYIKLYGMKGRLSYKWRKSRRGLIYHLKKMKKK